MAREYGRVWLSIWSDFEFGQLDSRSQWLYLALISQPGLNTVGVQSYAPKRWAGLAADVTPRQVESSIRNLERGRLVVIDRDTDELLIRSHIRYDRPLRSANVAKALARTWPQIASAELRKVVLVELHRLLDEGTGSDWPGWNVPEVKQMLQMPIPGGAS